MKTLSTLIIIFTLFIFASSCSKKAEFENENCPELCQQEYRDSLPGYKWLKSNKNLENDSYIDSFNYYFNLNIEKKRYNDAAIYLIAYGGVVGNKMEYDSLFYSIGSEFYNSYEDQIKGDSKTDICYYLGNQNHYIHDLAKSSDWLRKAVSVEPVSKQHKQMLGFSNFALAQNNANLGDFEEAERLLVKALEIFIDVGDKTNQGTVYLLLHSIYMYSSAYIEAEETLQKGLEIVRKQKNDALIFGAYTLYVHLNVAKSDTLAAIQYVDSLAAKAEDYPGIITYHKAILNQLLAFKYIALREEDEALKYLKISRGITDSINSPDLKMRTLFQEVVYANIFNKPLKNPEEVEEFYNRISNEEDPNKQYLNQLGTALFTVYTKKGDYKKANSYAELLMVQKDKASDDRMKGRLFELERKFESEQKENKILQQEKLLEAQKNMIIILTVGAVFLILVFLLFIVWNKNRSILREKLLSDNFTSQLLSKTEDERKRIASDLHDSVSNELVNLRHALENDRFKFKDKIDKILEEVRSISRNLSPTLFDKLGLKESVEQLTDRAQNQHSFLLTSDIEYNGSLNTNVELQLYRIIQEATTNMMKHANAMAGKITITEDAKFVYAEIKDNGKGFEVNKMLEKGNCFGLLNITERAKFINGTVQFKSDKAGTIIKVSIPK